MALLVVELLLAGPPGGCLGGAVGTVVLRGTGFLHELSSMATRWDIYSSLEEILALS